MTTRRLDLSEREEINLKVYTLRKHTTLNFTFSVVVIKCKKDTNCALHI